MSSTGGCQFRPRSATAKPLHLAEAKSDDDADDDNADLACEFAPAEQRFGKMEMHAYTPAMGSKVDAGFVVQILFSRGGLKSEPTADFGRRSGDGIEL